MYWRVSDSLVENTGSLVEVRIARHEDMCNQRLMAVGGDHEMHMCGSMSGSGGGPKHLADGAIERNRV